MFISSKVQRSMRVHSQRLCSNVNISMRRAARSSLFCAYSPLTLVMCSVSTNGERASLANLNLTIASLLECSLSLKSLVNRLS